MSEKGQCSYLRPAMYTLAILGGLVLVVSLFGGFEPTAVAARSVPGPGKPHDQCTSSRLLLRRGRCGNGCAVPVSPAIMA